MSDATCPDCGGVKNSLMTRGVVQRWCECADHEDEDESSAPPEIRSSEWVAWSQDEDDDLRHWYEMANGAFHSYRYMAEELNRRYHGGRNVRKPGAICRRDGNVNYGKPWGRSSNVGDELPTPATKSLTKENR
jgi:hypothetical protein